MDLFVLERNNRKYHLLNHIIPNMTLFFILLIALVVYQFTTRKSLSQIYPQFDRRQIRRLTDAPFYVTGWALLFILVAYALSALTAMIGELFNVDNYIAIFSGGWLGLILQFFYTYAPYSN